MSLETDFPRLNGSGFKKTSPRDNRYNCIAFAAGNTNSWWDFVSNPQYFWPASVARNESIETLIEVFRTLGFVECSDGRFEPDFERIALYGTEIGYEHAARQIRDGWWTSTSNIDWKLWKLEFTDASSGS